MYKYKKEEHLEDDVQPSKITQNHKAQVQFKKSGPA